MTILNSNFKHIRPNFLNYLISSPGIYIPLFLHTKSRTRWDSLPSIPWIGIMQNQINNDHQSLPPKADGVVLSIWRAQDLRSHTYQDPSHLCFLKSHQIVGPSFLPPSSQVIPHLSTNKQDIKYVWYPFGASTEWQNICEWIMKTETPH